MSPDVVITLIVFWNLPPLFRFVRKYNKRTKFTNITDIDDVSPRIYDGTLAFKQKKNNLVTAFNLRISRKLWRSITFSLNCGLINR
jgi:hypothetical protein